MKCVKLKSVSVVKHAATLYNQTLYCRSGQWCRIASNTITIKLCQTFWNSMYGIEYAKVAVRIIIVRFDPSTNHWVKTSAIVQVSTIPGLGTDQWLFGVIYLLWTLSVCLKGRLGYTIWMNYMLLESVNRTWNNILEVNPQYYRSQNWRKTVVIKKRRYWESQITFKRKLI